MRLGIYIGSFNPPHLGHKKVIDFLLENNYVDNVLIVPTGNYWNKTNIIIYYLMYFLILCFALSISKLPSKYGFHE